MLTHIVAKTIVFNEDGKVLILHRSVDDTYRPGGTDFPGGKVDEGEDIFSGAIREMTEEAGLEFASTDLELLFASNYAGYNTDTETDINFVWLGFVTKLPEGQAVRLSHEHQSFDWLTIDEAIAICDAPTQKSFMEAIRNRNLVEELATVEEGSS